MEKVFDSGVPGRVHYLPHRAVIRRDKETSKTRMVVNASAKEKGGKSLNDCLYPGPCMLKSIFDILIRFCFGKIAIVADIRQAFLNIGIREEDRDFLRFLFPDKSEPEKILIYRFLRGCFGVTSMPLLMNGTIEHHMNSKKAKDQNVVELVDQFLRDLYVDDVTTAVNTVTEGKVFHDFAKNSMKEAGLELRKWGSNSLELQNYMNGSDCPERPEKKILGITWNHDDEFVCDFSKVVEEALKLPLTKRNILRIGASFFDPRGLIAPITMIAKMYFQMVCLDSYNWDQILSEELARRWTGYLNHLGEIGNIRVPRYLFPKLDITLSRVNLHGYADASTQAYCAVIYVQVEFEDQYFSRIIVAKTKVAPIKPVSIPKLELLACLLLVELMQSLSHSLKDVIIIDEVVYWSDSEVALAWINGVDKVWEVWVQNRVNKIHELSKGLWYYVPTSMNPADIGTRESSAITFVTNNLWWEGPPQLAEKFIPPMDNKMLNIPETISFTSHDGPDLEPVLNLRKLMDPEKYSTLHRLLLVTGLVLRALKIMRKTNVYSGEIVNEEKENALVSWIKTEQKLMIDDKKFKNLKKQLSLICDNNGVIGLKGRLDNSFMSYDSKHPILLDRNSHVTKLIILKAHESVKHMRLKSTLNQVRSKYWVCKARQTVQSAIKNCVICRYVTGSPILGPAPPDLPEFRVAYEFAYTNIGADYGGPIYVKDVYAETEMHKAYFLLFTCAATRNVHIELCPNMSASCLLRALKRFIGRRGKFAMAISDNFKTFLSAELQVFLTNEGIDWKYILAKSPWWGAFYERLIRIIKEALKKCLGKAKLTYEEMETALVEVEAAINSRPLTYIYGDEMGEALTPSHLAIGRRLLNTVSISEQNDNELSHVTMNARYQHLQKVLNHFWKRFSSEYLLELHEHHLANKGKYDELSKLLLGDIVLIKDDKLKRNSWRRGKVESLIEGRDGKVRGAVLKVFDKGKITYIERPIRRIIPLEVKRESEQ